MSRYWADDVILRLANCSLDPFFAYSTRASCGTWCGPLVALRVSGQGLSMDQLRENYDAVLASPWKRMESTLIGSRSSTIFKPQLDQRSV